MDQKNSEKTKLLNFGTNRGQLLISCLLFFVRPADRTLQDNDIAHAWQQLKSRQCPKKGRGTKHGWDVNGHAE